MASIYVAIMLCLVLTSQRSFVDTASLPPHQDTSDTSQTQDANVQELESLKHSIGKTLEMMKSQSSIYTNVNGQKEEHAESKEEINENGKLIGSVGRHIDATSDGLEGNPSGKMRTEIDIPSKGIHKSIEQEFTPEYSTQTENGSRRSTNAEAVPDMNNNLDKYNSFSGVQYSPLDMAEYVFWTGDEKGVTLAIEEFLQEGLMSREEAISFLQDIKYNLDYLKSHYTQLGLNSREHLKERENSIEKNPVYNKVRTSSKKPELRNIFDINQLRQEVNKKNDATEPITMPLFGKGVAESMVAEKHQETQGQDDDYDELLERLRVADFLYTEYSLEEVIYQLAKVMFTQSLTRGSAEAQQALQKFTTFLEMEAEKGHISRALEKKVLDVLIASLSDTLTEHPELLATAHENLGGGSQANISGQNFLKQILELSPDDKAAVRAAIMPYKNQNGRNQFLAQLKESKNTNHVPLGLGKYKTP